MELLYFILACWGLTQILVYGTIFNKIRPKEGFFGELFKCPMCVGFWVGILHWLFFFEMDCGILQAGFISSATSYMLCMLFTDYGINLKLNQENKE
jgi:hypothetical protein